MKLLSLTLLGFCGLAFAAPVQPTYVSQTYVTKHAKGYVHSRKAHAFLATAPRRSFNDSDVAVPSTYSLRTQAGPVEDQGACGSCWDFSLTSALRGTWILAGKDPGRLSFNYLLNCATTMSGCDGGDFSAAQYLVAPQGVPAYGTDGSYVGQNATCVTSPAVASAVNYTLIGSDGGLLPGQPSPSFKDIAYVVGVLHQPISIDVAVDDAWENYSSGVYNACGYEDPANINHMVVIEGYDCETAVDSSGHCTFDSNGNLPAGVGTWLIRNSWGDSWGDHGYITTKATDKDGKACNAVASDALYYTLAH
jgi:C1A family cysteine protease